MKKFLYLSAILAAFCLGRMPAESQQQTDMMTSRDMFLQERAFFFGQRKAMSSDIRIQWKDTAFVWIKSPWDNGRPPMYKPNRKDSTQ